MNEQRGEIDEDQSGQDRLYGRRQSQVSNWPRERKGILVEGNSMCEGQEAAMSMLLSWENQNSLTREDSSCWGWWEIKLDKYGKIRIVKVLERQAK